MNQALTPLDLSQTVAGQSSTFALNDLPDLKTQIRELISEMYQALALDNAVWITTTGPENEPVQVQLIVTRNPADFMDEG